MRKPFRARRQGFTLVEIMIVASIIAFLAAIAVPGFLRSRKRGQAARIMEDLHLIDAAIDQYAIENNLTTGAAVSWLAVKKYLKPNTNLYTSGADILGDPYPDTFKVDETLGTPVGTDALLGDAVPPSFWSPFTLQ